MQTATALHPTGTRVWSIARPWPALGVLFFGLIVLYAVGFSTVTQAHNAAHDTRHANAVPAHLLRRFAITSLATTGMFWLLLGTVGGFISSRNEAGSR